DALAVLEDLQMLAGATGRLEPGPGRPGGQPRQPAAAQVVAVLGLLGPPQRLAIEQVTGVEAAAIQEQADAVVVVPRGQHLVGPLELAGSDAPLFRSGRRHLRGASGGHRGALWLTSCRAAAGRRALNAWARCSGATPPRGVRFTTC